MKPEAVEKITVLEENGDPIATTIITTYELLKGAYLSRTCEESLAKITEILSSMQVLDLTFKACN